MGCQHYGLRPRWRALSVGMSLITNLAFINSSQLAPKGVANDHETGNRAGRQKPCGKQGSDVPARYWNAWGTPVEQYERVCLNALLVSPGLAECTPQSMDIAITHCITAGLIPDGKEAVIVPFKGVATLIPMVDGVVKCAHNAIKGLTIRARVVYQGDEFEYRDGAQVVLKHTMGAFCDPPPRYRQAANQYHRGVRGGSPAWQHGTGYPWYSTGQPLTSIGATRVHGLARGKRITSRCAGKQWSSNC